MKKLSKEEMKKVMGGVIDWDSEVPGDGNSFCSSGPCRFYESGKGYRDGTCSTNSNGRCVCSTGTASVIWEGPDQCAGA